MEAVSQTKTISRFRGLCLTQKTYFCGIGIYTKSKVYKKGEECQSIFRDLDINKVLHGEDNYIKETFLNF
jgi:hypothetical protein